LSTPGRSKTQRRRPWNLPAAAVRGASLPCRARNPHLSCPGAHPATAGTALPDLVRRGSISTCDTGVPAQILDRAGALHLRADPLHELGPMERHQAAILVPENGGVHGRFNASCPLQRPFERRRTIAPPRRNVAETPAGAPNWIEQIKELFLPDQRGHRKSGPNRVRGNGCAQAPRFRHDAGNAEKPMSSAAFVSKSTCGGNARQGGAFDGRCAVGIDRCFEEAVVRNPAVAGRNPTQTMSTSMR